MAIFNVNLDKTPVRTNVMEIKESCNGIAL